MNNNINENKKRALVGAAASTVVLLLFGFVLIANPITAVPPSTTVVVNAGANCADSVHFFTYDVTQNFFGPASASADVETQKSELHNRRCSDPALAVAHQEYQAGAYSSPQERLAKTQTLIDDKEAWRLTVMSLETRESSCSASLQTMSGNYQTLWMRKGASSSDIPGIYQASPEKPSYDVLRFDCAGSQLNYKLDCGFQPVATSFVGVPTLDQPAPSTPSKPRPNSPPATTIPKAPPTTTGGCPPGYNCKDPSRGIGNNPAACALGDCGPRPVNPTPPPADAVVPTATVAPPPVTLPPPAPLPEPRPVQTTPVTVPQTAPG